MFHSEHVLLNDALQPIFIDLRTTFFDIVLLQDIFLELVGMNNLLAIEL